LGAISRSANSRTLFFNCSCSSFSCKSKKPPLAEPVIDYTIAEVHRKVTAGTGEQEGGGPHQR
jgi:hypothetical protein